MGLLDIGSFFTGLIINLLLISLICYYFKRKYENLEESLNEQAKILYELLERDKSIKDDNIEKIYNNEIINDFNTVSQLETDKEDDDDDYDDIEDNEKDEEDDEDDEDDEDEKDVNDDENDVKMVVNKMIETPNNNFDTSGVKYVEMKDITIEKESSNILDIKIIKDIDNKKEQQEENTIIEDSIIKESIVIQNDIECPITMDTTELNEITTIEKDNKDIETPYTKNNKDIEIDIEVPEEEDEYEIYDESNPNNNYNKMSVKELRNILSNKGVNVSSKMKKNELLSLIQGKKSLIIDMALEDN